jgi:hypothetical protein
MASGIGRQLPIKHTQPVIIQKNIFDLYKDLFQNILKLAHQLNKETPTENLQGLLYVIKRDASTIASWVRIAPRYNGFPRLPDILGPAKDRFRAIIKNPQSTKEDIHIAKAKLFVVTQIIPQLTRNQHAHHRTSTPLTYNEIIKCIRETNPTDECKKI